MTNRLTVRDIVSFQFGNADAIRKVASSSAAIWTGIALTVLTAFARNYDQTFIPEQPVLWFFGPLLFSLVSGTWLYLVCYQTCASRLLPADEMRNRTDWRGFMGTFWMTAPIAWLYAIPVERFVDSIGSVYANITLLIIVAIWRVILMGRVLNVITGVPFGRTILWVILAASLEVLVITFVGGTLAYGIGRGMMGMRNSPEEDIILAAMGNASSVAVFGFIASFLILAIFRWKGVAKPWPSVQRSTAPWIPLIIGLLGWGAITVPNQIQLARNTELESLINRGQYRQALDRMNRWGREKLAPARPPPPKMFEWDSTNQAFAVANNTTNQDAEWIVEHVAHCLDDAVLGLAVHGTKPSDSDELKITRIGMGVHRFRVDPALIYKFLQRSDLPALLSEWRSRQRNLYVALRVSAERLGKPSADPDSEEWYWRLLAGKLDAMAITNVTYPDLPETRKKGTP
jgi:hypothetical protein